MCQAWGELATGYTQQGKDHKLLSPEVKQLMKPLHRAVKEASLAISNSPWSNLTSNHPGLMGPPSLSSLTSRTQPPRFLNKAGMAVNGSGLAWPGPINTSIPAVASAFSAQPYSAASLASQSSSGYITPVPATPLSAALGAAAQATVPSTPKFSAMGGQPSSTLKVFDRADKLLSQTSRRI